jgi:glycosyltransferase involved in cell wall biosynthesis
MGIFKRLGKRTIGFWAGDENNFQFLMPLIDELSKDYKVKKFDYVDDVEKLKSQLQSVDLGWFEWGNGPIVPASTFSDIKTPRINRIHRYEVYTETPLHVQWNNVSELLFSSPSMIKRFKKKFPKQSKEVPIKLIEIGLDTDLFAFHDKPMTKEIIYAGRLHPHKNPSLMLQIMAKLVQTDPEYKLKVIGGFHDELYEEYFYDQLKKLKLEKNVIFLGKLTHQEMVEHLQKADFFLITSIIEGLSQASLEAMACGVRPVIFDYYGSEEAYPRKFLYNTVDEAVEMMVHPVATRRECREFVEEKYDLKDKVRLIKQEIDRLMK